MFARSLALTGAAAAILVPTAAHAATAAPAAPRATTAYLGTYGFGRAGIIGQAGLSGGLWAASTVRTGFAGDDLIVTYTPRTTAYATEKVVYTATYNTVADPQGECRKVGADGVARKVWMSFRCRTGIAPNYTLLVR